VLLLIGTTETEFAGSHLDLIYGEPDDPGVAPAPDPDAVAHYRHLHAAMQAGLIVSCHDISEGGLAVALAEMCIGGRLGASISTLPHDDHATALFSESMGRLIVEVEERSVPAFKRIMDDDVVQIGEVSESGLLSMPQVEPIAVSDLVDAFNTFATPGEPLVSSEEQS
jgi:phosphoribosylformylglycinamidine (FGAM) synthase-like enzyme